MSVCPSAVIRCRPSFDIAHHYQRSSFPKPLSRSKPKFMQSLNRKGGESLNKRSGSHDLDARHEHFIVKSSKLFFSGNKSHIILKLRMEHWGLKLYKIYINDDPWMTLAYFMTGSNQGLFVWKLLGQMWLPICLNGEKLLQKHCGK